MKNILNVGLFIMVVCFMVVIGLAFKSLDLILYEKSITYIS